MRSMKAKLSRHGLNTKMAANKSARGLFDSSDTRPSRAIQALAQVKQRVRTENKKVGDLPADYKAFLLDFNIYLHNLRINLDEVEKGLLSASQETKDSYRRAVELWLGPKVVATIHDFNIRFGG